MRDILRKHVPQLDVWAFGSRAKWTAKPYSDLDLAVITDQPLPLAISASLADDFSESDLPWKVDVVDWATTNDTFRKIIERDKVVVQRGERSLGMAGEWMTFQLGNVCSKIGSGATPRGGSSVYLDQGQVAFIRSQNVYNHGFNREGLVYLTEQHAAELANVEVAEHDVLLNITGDSVARACQVDPSILPARVNQHVAIIRPDSKILSPRFLRYYLVSPQMQAHMLTLAGAGATRNALTKGMIESFEIPGPADIHEQRAIAHILGTLDDKIELNRRRNQTLEAMARALFKDWFVDFGPVRAKMEGRETYLPPDLWHRFPDRLDDDGKPEGWETKRVSDFLSLAYGKSLPAGKRNHGNIPVYGSGGITGFHDEALINGKAIIVGRKGTVGSLYWEDRPSFPIDTVFYVQPVTPLSFCYYLLESLPLREMNTDAAVPGLNRENVYRLEVAEPPPALISAFAETASRLRERIAASSRESENLTQLRDTLLPKLISGELRIKDAEKFLERVG